MAKYLLIVLSTLLMFSCSNFQDEQMAKTSEYYFRELTKNMFSEPAKAILFSKKYIEVNKKRNINDSILLGYGCLTMAFYNNNELDSITYYTEEALKYTNTPKKRFLTQVDLADVFQEYNYNQAALILYEESLKLVKDNNLSKNDEDYVNREINFIRYKIHQVEDRALQGRIKAYEKALGGDDMRQLRYTRLYLIQAFIEHNMPNETFKLIEEGLIDSKARNNIKFQYLFNKMKAEAYLQKEEFNLALKFINIAKELVKKIHHKKYAVEAEYILARIYEKQAKYNLQVNILEDIICENKRATLKDFYKYYKLLTNGYLQLGNIDRYVEYSQAYTLEVEQQAKRDMEALSKSHEITETVKANIIADQKNEKTNWILAFLAVCLILLLFFIRHKIIENKNKELFNSLMDKIKTYEAQELKNEPMLNIKGDGATRSVFKESKYNIQKEKPKFNANDDKFEAILEKLKKLEAKHYYLKQNCTLHSTAKQLKTNTSYLSKVINNHLGKNFSTYINELRINYVVLELKRNKTLRAYSIKAIAEEIGYKKTSTFSKYFKEITGISPSVYIKNLSKKT
ncbi:helix-turn-helix domain-containing protein [Pontimicrobium sp. MEBiC01747]